MQKLSIFNEKIQAILEQDSKVVSKVNHIKALAIGATRASINIWMSQKKNILKNVPS